MTAEGRPPGALLDCAAIARELGVSRRASEAIMRQLPVTSFPGLRKLYVKRADLERLIDESTWPPVSAKTREMFRR
jgi:hypothetical protein